MRTSTDPNARNYSPDDALKAQIAADRERRGLGSLAQEHRVMEQRGVIDDKAQILELYREALEEQRLDMEVVNDCLRKGYRVNDQVTRHRSSNLVGKVTAGGIKALVRAAVAGAIDDIRAQQPNGTWALAAFVAEYENTLVKRTFIGGKKEDLGEVDPKTVHSVMESVLVITMRFVDTRNAPTIVYKNGQPDSEAGLHPSIKAWLDATQTQLAANAPKEVADEAMTALQDENALLRKSLAQLSGDFQAMREMMAGLVGEESLPQRQADPVGPEEDEADEDPPGQAPEVAPPKRARRLAP